VATDFDRDDRLQGLLRETLRNQTVNGPCPDAAALAAWAEGALTPEETDAIDSHLATCARCRELAATLSSLPEAEVAPAAVVPFTPRGNGRWKVIAGAMGAVAASALIWIAVRDEAPSLDTKSASNQTQPSQPRSMGGRAAESAPAQAQQGQALLATPGPESKSARENPARAAELAQRSLKPSAAPVEPPATRPASPPPAVMPPPPALLPPPAAPLPMTTTATAGAARSSTVTGLPQSTINITVDNTKPADLARSTEGFFAVNPPVIAEFVVGADLLAQQGQGFGAAADTFRAGGGGGRGGGGGGGRGSGAGGNASGAAAAAQRTAAVAAPATEPARWRLRAPSPPAAAIAAVERSNDGGVTWQRVEIPATPALSSGSAPTNTVCWLVGHAGTVLLSTDGKTFRQVTKPTEADLVSVRATDARSATVRTADGQTFVTTDGGTTWIRSE
jgi:hypothetical protein